MTTPSTPRDRKVWSLWLLLPLALFGPPILGIGLVGTLPHPLSTNGSVVGLLLFPFIAAGLALYLGATRAEPGAKRLVFLLVAGGNILLWLLLLFIGMLAP